MSLCGSETPVALDRGRHSHISASCAETHSTTLLQTLQDSCADPFLTASVSSYSFANMGKVHGSLARAGKVKGQTPKVEKQEKPKQPKGRAKKRLLYNRYVLCANE